MSIFSLRIFHKNLLDAFENMTWLYVENLHSFNNVFTGVYFVFQKCFMHKNECYNVAMLKRMIKADANFSIGVSLFTKKKGWVFLHLEFCWNKVVYL